MLRWIPVLFLISCLVGTGLGAAQTMDAPLDDAAVLYLRPDPQPPVANYNFTTTPPTGASTPVPAHTINGFQALWTWKMWRVPEPWTLAEGTDLRLEFWLGGLDRVLPIHDQLDAPGQLRLEVIVLHRLDDVPVRRTMSLDPHLPGDEAPVHVVMDLPVSRTTEYEVEPGNATFFGVDIILHGRMAPDDRAWILTGGDDHPARFVVPTFPVQAFTAWEDAERAETECLKRILQDLPCEEPVVPTPPPDVEEGPGVAFALVVALLAGLAVRGRDNRSRA